MLAQKLYVKIQQELVNNCVSVLGEIKDILEKLLRKWPKAYCLIKPICPSYSLLKKCDKVRNGFSSVLKKQNFQIKKIFSSNVEQCITNSNRLCEK